MNDKASIYNQICESAAALKDFNVEVPDTAIMMGTGLANIVDEIKVELEVPYGDLPYFPKSTVQSHPGKLVIGKLEGNRVLVLVGRWHYYEGYSAKELTFPIRVLKMAGVKRIFFTNVTGAVNPQYNSGDLIVVKDHINFHPDHPLRGDNDDRLGPRFPDMMHTYSASLRETILKCAKAQKLTIHEGVYFGLQGPSLETPAEYKFINMVGGDIVGMSTLPEVIVAKHAGMELATISIVSNVCFPLERLTETTIASVIEVAQAASVKLVSLLKAVVQAN